jgi:hypothetical protein
VRWVLETKFLHKRIFSQGRFLFYAGLADRLAEDLNSLFDRMIDVSRIKHGNRQTIDTLISEETLLFAKYLRQERKDWSPRLASL